MKQNEYTENLFRSVDTIVAERIKNLSYDYTQLMEITDDNNANAGIYKVKLNSDTDIIAYADNPSYQTGDQVYVLNTGDGDRRFILGTFLKNPTGRIDRSNSDLLKLQNDVDNLLYSTEDLKASLLILPGQLRSEMQSLDERFSSKLEQTAEKFSMRFEDTERKLESNFLMTAEMLRTEFSDEINGLHSTFTQTAGMFQTEVVDEFNQRWSRITQTADEIKSEVADDMNGLYSVIDQTAGEIRSEVHDSMNDLHSLIDQTAGEIRLEVTDGLNSQQATLDILASGITARVENIEIGYSEISQTADSISTRVESLYGNYSQILQTADSITSRVEGLYQNFSEIKQTADSITSRVEGIDENYSEILQTADMIRSRVEDVNGYASMIEQKADSIRLTVDNPDENGKSSTIHLKQGEIELSSGEIKFDGLVSFSNLSGDNPDPQGRTIINGDYIKTGTIDAKTVGLYWGNSDNKGGGFTVAVGATDDNDTSALTYGSMMYGWEDGIETKVKWLREIEVDGGKSYHDGQELSYSDIEPYLPNHYFIATNLGVRMTSTDNSGKGSFYLNGSSAHLLGNSIQVGDGGVWTTSDRNKKNTISYNLLSYDNFFDQLKPSLYKFNKGTSNRFHLGFIYQDVESALLHSNLTSQDFAGLVKQHDSNGEVLCGLRYDEFIALNTHMIQKTRKELEEKDSKIQQLENRIDELEQKLNLLLETLS